VARLPTKKPNTSFAATLNIAFIQTTKRSDPQHILLRNGRHQRTYCHFLPRTLPPEKGMDTQLPAKTCDCTGNRYFCPLINGSDAETLAGPRRRMWRRSPYQHALPASTMADAPTHHCSPRFVPFLTFSVAIYLRGAVIARVHVQAWWHPQSSCQRGSWAGHFGWRSGFRHAGRFSTREERGGC